MARSQTPDTQKAKKKLHRCSFINPRIFFGLHRAVFFSSIP